MQAITVVRQNAASGYLPAITAGAAFCVSARCAELAGQAIIAPPGSSVAPEPPRIGNRSPGLSAGPQNASR